MPDPRETPAMQQYYRFKQRHPGCVLLFRIGDFYEMFDDDAVTVSRAIGLTLTQRTAGVPMCGLPHHQLEPYLKKLIDKGFRVAVCEQIEPAENAKGLVARAVTRVLTPGTLVDHALLDDASASTLGAVCFTGEGDQSPAALAVVDASTGAFDLMHAPADAVVDELLRRSVRELLFAPLADNSAPPRVQRCLDALGLSGTPRPTWHFRRDEALQALLEHFGVRSLAGYGLRDDDPAVPAAGALLRYLQETQTASSQDAEAAAGIASGAVPRSTLAHLRPPRLQNPGDTLVIDAVSLRALEVERTIRAPAQGTTQAASDGSLVGLFLSGGTGSTRGGVCATPMGKRLLRDWLCRPSGDLATIRARHDAVSALKEDRRLAEELASLLARVPDVSRIAGRLALGRATPRDLVALAAGVAQGPPLLALLEGVRTFANLIERLRRCVDLAPLAARTLSACVDEPPPHLREGGLIRDGVDAELDEARSLQKDAGQWLVEYQQRLLAEHALPGLKVGYNRVFGYYIELTSAQARQAPSTFTRKQTLKNAERYITPELHDFERRVSTAESRALSRERQLFDDLCAGFASRQGELAAFADALAEIDVLRGFAEHAARAGWVRPDMSERPILRIHDGRHPVLERTLGRDFVPNDVALRDDDAPSARTPSPDPSVPDAPPASASDEADLASLALITGPNMAGKSTFIRQVALITLLAHAGSFVPASRATIGLCDRIFTRIGADDALHAGQSTFMVEMTETANILHHASERSLVILDEIGRGTSTLDGLSLAWAITEYLAALGCRTLFATHYHELTDLAEPSAPSHSDTRDADIAGRIRPAAPRLRNLHVAVREWPLDASSPAGETQIIFLHRILPGRTDQSYGIHVARLAGIPSEVIARARDVLESLAVHHAGDASRAARPQPAPEAPGRGARAPRSSARDDQLPLFTEFVRHPAVDQLREVKLDQITPLQAFDLLRQLHGMATDPRDR